MKLVALFIVALTLVLGIGCKQQEKHESESIVIANGTMPNIISINNSLHVTYGSGDSIMYISSADNGKTFSAPELVATIPQLVASHMRGPQIAGTGKSLTIIACNKPGDIFSYSRDESGKWNAGNKVNDVDTISKEGFTAMASSGTNTFAVWLDLRDDKRNKIYGASSPDAGKTWSKNKLVYASPDSTVCECCKPSVIVNGDQVIVMFRNWLKGNRDLYLIHSNDGGKNFGEAQKLGTGSWALNGCPMDGGGLALADDNKIQTVWHREGKIYSCIPGKEEKEIGAGRSCTLATINQQTVYAWTEKGEIICMLPKLGRKVIGKGQGPVLKPLGNDKIACVWENEKQIKIEVINL